MRKTLTHEHARALLADESNWWDNEELCYVCGELHDGQVEYRGFLFCRDKCCNDYIRIYTTAHTNSGAKQ